MGLRKAPVKALASTEDKNLKRNKTDNEKDIVDPDVNQNLKKDCKRLRKTCSKTETNGFVRLKDIKDRYNNVSMTDKTFKKHESLASNAFNIVSFSLFKLTFLSRKCSSAIF